MRLRFFQNTLKISRGQYDRLLRIRDLGMNGNAAPLENNFRNIQDQGERTVLEYNKTIITKINTIFIILTTFVQVFRYIQVYSF